MLRIRTTIDGQHKFLDIYEDEPVLMNLSFAELQDITQKNSAFSQSFNLPGTKNNNEIFNFYFDINQVPVDFNPNNKFETILSWNGWQIMQGYIRLDGVSITNDEIIYNVTFYNQIGDLAANIGDKFLRDLDLSSLSHPYTSNVILESQLDPNLFPLTGSTNYSYQNGKTFWGLFNIGYEYYSGNTNFVNTDITPLVEFSPLTGNTYIPQSGYTDYSGTPVHDYYFKPAIQVKELYTQICNQAGYKIDSDFFDTSYFEKFYLPLKFLDETVYARNAQKICFKYTNSPFNLVDLFTNPNPSTGQTCNNLNLSTTTRFIYFPAELAGNFKIKVNFNYTSTLTDECYFDAENTNCSEDFVFEYNDVDGNLVQETIPAIDCNLSFGPYYGCCARRIDGRGTFYYAGSSSNYKLYIAYTDYSTLPYPTTYVETISEATSKCNQEIGSVSFDYNYTVNGLSDLEFYFTGSETLISNWTFEVLEGPRVIESGQTINYGLEFPDNDYKQIDFITSINRYFNLVVVPNPDNPKSLIIEPIIDYIGKGKVLDWTTKVDDSQPQTLRPTTSLINGTLQYSFKLDQDYANQNFKNASNRIFGSEKVKLNQEYKDQVTNFDYMFSSPLDITINSAYSSYLTLSSFSRINQLDNQGTPIQQFLPFKILPRLVFRGLVASNDSYGFVFDPITSASTYQVWYLKTYEPNNFIIDRFQNINRFTTYPFNYSGFSHYINWRGEDQVQNITPEFSFVAEDLYDIYYKDYIEDLLSDENKIYSAKIYLYPEEIQQLRFNEKILINNAYFRINKITNFNLLEPSICDVELIKLTKDYRPHRKLCYQLTPCASGSTLFSNSDLNYNLYAYIGNYVNLYDDDLNALGCYYVDQVCCRDDFDFKHYYLSSGYTNNLVAVYPDCGCSGRTSFDLIQNGSVDNDICPTPTPTQTPYSTPTNTKTPTPTPTNTITQTQTPTLTQTPTETQNIQTLYLFTENIYTNIFGATTSFRLNPTYEIGCDTNYLNFSGNITFNFTAYTTGSTTIISGITLTNGIKEDFIEFGIYEPITYVAIDNLTHSIPNTNIIYEYYYPIYNCLTNDFIGTLIDTQRYFNIDYPYTLAIRSWYGAYFNGSVCATFESCFGNDVYRTIQSPSGTTYTYFDLTGYTGCTDCLTQISTPTPTPTQTNTPTITPTTPFNSWFMTTIQDSEPCDICTLSGFNATITFNNQISGFYDLPTCDGIVFSAGTMLLNTGLTYTFTSSISGVTAPYSIDYNIYFSGYVDNYVGTFSYSGYNGYEDVWTGFTSGFTGNTLVSVIEDNIVYGYYPPESIDAYYGNHFGYYFVKNSICLITQTPTPTQTNTPTITPSPTITSNFSRQILLTSGSTTLCEGCSLSNYPIIGYIGYSLIPTLGLTIYTNPELTIPFNGNDLWYKSNFGNNFAPYLGFKVGTDGKLIEYIVQCELGCPTPTPTQTITQTPTSTLPLALTSTPTPSITQTNTPTLTKTPTGTPAGCFIYDVYIDDGTPDPNDYVLYWDDCNGDSQAMDTTNLQTYSVCTKDPDSIFGDYIDSIVKGVACIQPTPTPTITPSSTPTCIAYEIYIDDGTGDRNDYSLSWEDCFGNIRSRQTVNQRTYTICTNDVNSISGDYIDSITYISSCPDTSITTAGCGGIVTPIVGITGTTTYRITGITGTGNISFQYDAIDIPDQFVLYWNGIQQINTGFVSSCYPSSCGTYNSQLNALGYPNVSGPNGTQTFYKSASTPSEVYVTVTAPIDGTGWGFIVSCT